MLEVGSWYRSKRGHLCRVEMLYQDGTVTVTSHYTGNKVKLGVEEVKHLKEAEEPDTPPGTAMQIISEEEKDDYFDMYKKYKHIIPGSIYKVCTTIKLPAKEEKYDANGKTRVKKVKSSAKGSTRCKIKCKTPKCKNIRDIKIQDAWITEHCEACRDIKNKERIQKFLQKMKKK